MTEYMASLVERTRRENGQMKWGFDWVMYNLGLELYGRAVRLPFVPHAAEGEAQTKSEAELGIDLAFLSADRTELVLFVLKASRLTNATWTGKDFFSDLAKASLPDLSAEGYAQIKKVRIILAYNKDDDATGIELYERFKQGNSAPIGNGVERIYERWDLFTIVDHALGRLLSPALVPQAFFGQLNYLCAQFAEFKHGSEPWELQLLPAWRRFVSDALSEGTAARGFWLIPVALIILQEHGKGNPSSETGWIELIEWASVAIWRTSLESGDLGVQEAAIKFWNGFYLEELSRFYKAHHGALATKHSVDQFAVGSFAGVIATSAIAHWHLGRLGLLSYSAIEASTDDPKPLNAAKRARLHELSNWLIAFVNANHSTHRPILDIQHIEWYLVVMLLHSAMRLDEAAKLLEGLSQYLFTRRIGPDVLPFLDRSNSMAYAMEQMGEGAKSGQETPISTAFIQMLLELCCLLHVADRDRLLPLMHSRLVLGAYDDSDEATNKPLSLLSWIPPAGWSKKVLNGYVDDGEVVMVSPISTKAKIPVDQLVSALRDLSEKMTAVSPLPDQEAVPRTALILASMLHRSPLPPEFWRNIAFPPATA